MKRIISFLLICAPALALASPVLDGHFTQGGLIYGKVAPHIRVYWGDQRLNVSPEGHFILGFGRDAELNHSLYLIDRSGQVSSHDLQIAKRTYQIQRIDGISERMMEPTVEDQLRITREATQVSQARRIHRDLPYFKESFIWPVTGRISGVYGSQRILNGEPRRPHFGIDIAAPTGTKIKAPAGGVVSLDHDGMFYSGKTLIIDHGHGLSSSFLHLSKILVQQDDIITQGQVIAEVGATGRVTGPHLDWRVNWFEHRLDPALLAPKMPEQ